MNENAKQKILDVFKKAKQKQEMKKAVQSKTIDERIGNIEGLNTNVKVNVVEAINELVTRVLVLEEKNK